MARHGRPGPRRTRLHLPPLLSGLAHRGASTLLVLIVALVACAAASTGPAYYASAQTSILRDTLSNAPLVERSFEIVAQGEVDHQLDPLDAAVQRVVATTVTDAAARDRLLAAPIRAIEAGAYDAALPGVIPLVWRDGVCAHLHLQAGRCPTATDEVLISSSLADLQGWRTGQRLRLPGWPALTIVGRYAVPDWTADFWFGRGATYFPNEDTAKGDPKHPPGPDAMFTVKATLDEANGHPQGSLVIDLPVATQTVRENDLSRLAGLSTAFTNDQSLAGLGASTTTQAPAIVDTVHASWRSLAVPVVLISAQLLVLVWLLMFLVVRDAIDARGPEIALMKLRGRRRLRLLGFALGEPVTLLAIALPLGVLAGGLACAVLNRALLRPGTPTQLPALTWAAAGVATLGGLIATVVAGWRTLRRPVVDQWQHAGREATRRGWAIDAALVTAAVGGLAELVFGGHVTSVHQGSSGLLMPGLLGLAVAVLAARLLPLLARALYRYTRRRGGLGPFLAMRHIARRATSMRTTIILATAFALATFSVASWGTSRANRQLVSEVGVGAPTVLSVVPPRGADLGAIVDRIDPGGTRAAVVDYAISFSGGYLALLAVDPSRFGHVVAWRSSFGDRPIADLMAAIAPKVAPSIAVAGDQIRLRLDVERLDPPGLTVTATVTAPGAESAVDIALGSLDASHGPATFTARLPSNCPCTLDRLALASPVPAAGGHGSPISGSLLVDGIDVHDRAGWHSLPGIGQPTQWRPTIAAGQPDQVELASIGTALRWPLSFNSAQVVALQVADRPAQLPALLDRRTAAASTGPSLQLPGLDQNALPVRLVGTTSVIPGALTGGVVVDRTLAERASSGVLSGLVTQQVWVADGAADAVVAGLERAGVRITQNQSAAAQADVYARQGPGLASTLFLADAIAAAVLAAAGAVMGLVSAGRRRRFEYAALRATGASVRSLFGGLLIEQVVVLLFGAVAGAVAGVAAALIAVRSVPEFVTDPVAPPLSYAPPAGVLTLALLLAFAVLLVVATISSWVLLSGIRADRLREAPP